MSVGPAFDLLLCLGLLWLAWGVVATRALFRSVVLFMVFGLLMAVTWARLGAPDVALAEAVIGAGIAGALLLGACKAMLSDPVPERAASAVPSTPVPRPLAAAISILSGTVLAWLMAARPSVTGAVPDAVAAESAGHFLSNPVSMVLLDMRAFDTLMETVVLLLACAGTRALANQSGLAAPFAPGPEHRRRTEPLVTVITPFLLVVALYLLWAGSHAPGGAFQAGALLAALGILYQLTGGLQPTANAGPTVRGLLVVGPLTFSVFAWLGLAWSGVPFGWPSQGGYPLVLGIELTLMLSIAVSLVLLFAARPGLRLERER